MNIDNTIQENPSHLKILVTQQHEFDSTRKWRKKLKNRKTDRKEIPPRWERLKIPNVN